MWMCCLNFLRILILATDPTLPSSIDRLLRTEGRLPRGLPALGLQPTHPWKTEDYREIGTTKVLWKDDFDGPGLKRNAWKKIT
jgi:hypothetical protein